MNLPIESASNNTTSTIVNDDLAIANDEESSSIFRTCSTILAIVYIFLMTYQKATQERYPSKRFKNRTIMIVHILSGVVIVYIGCFLHIENEIKAISKKADDTNMTYRVILYYIMASSSLIHTLTVFRIVPHVMGEKRITIPLYIGAALINLHNGIILTINPCLPNAFLLWSSINTFMYQRFILVLLMFASIDWELIYTFSLIAGASLTYSLSLQQHYVYALLLFPIVYAPFHEKVSTWLNVPLEDTLDNNIPSDKNITNVQKEFRMYFEKVTGSCTIKKKVMPSTTDDDTISAEA